MTNRIRKYVAAKTALSQVLFRVNNRGRFFVVNGKEIPESEFLAANRVELEPTEGSKNNPDRKTANLRN